MLCVRVQIRGLCGRKICLCSLRRGRQRVAGIPGSGARATCAACQNMILDPKVFVLRLRKGFLKTYSLVPLPSVTTQILLRIHDKPLPAGKVFFEQGIPRAQRYAVVSAFDDEVYMGEHCLHLVQAGFVMSEKVRARKGVEGWEDLSRYEGRHCGGAQDFSCRHRRFRRLTSHDDFGVV